MVKTVNAENVAKKQQNVCDTDLVQDEVELKQQLEEIWHIKAGSGFHWTLQEEEVKERNIFNSILDFIDSIAYIWEY